MTTPFIHRLLQAAALLLLSLPAAAEDAPKCIYIEMAALPLRYVGQGLTPAVEGSIEGMPATMLVDTGAYDTMLTMTGVAKRGLHLSMTGRHVEGFGGVSRLYSTRLQDFAIGGVKSRRSVNLGVIYETSFPPSFDAIVGAPFLLQADLEVDLRAKQIRLFRPKDCGATPLRLWREDTIELPFERSYSDSPNPHFTVSVNGKELEAMIDTGAHRSLLTREAAKRVGIDVDGPDAKRLGDSGGIGSERAPTWIAKTASIQIGGETIRDAELHVVESRGVRSVDLYLGQDFLRSHRVLFAMSQRKLYIAYLGGDVFTRGSGLEPWMRQEAEDGNADAQYALAAIYRGGRGVARDEVQAEAWLARAGAAGQPHAGLVLGRRALLAKRPAEAIPLLRQALEQLPAERYGPLWLYNARLLNGEAELGRKELEASLDKQQDDDWPQPLTRFYLGKMDAARVLREAADDKALAQKRGCEAERYMAEWHAARGEQPRADELLAAAQAHCPRPAAASADKAVALQ